MTPEAKAIEAARECAEAIAKAGFYPSASPLHTQLTRQEILNKLSLPQLFAIVEAAEKFGRHQSWESGEALNNAFHAYHTAQKENR